MGYARWRTVRIHSMVFSLFAPSTYPLPPPCAVLPQINDLKYSRTGDRLLVIAAEAHPRMYDRDGRFLSARTPAQGRCSEGAGEGESLARLSGKFAQEWGGGESSAHHMEWWFASCLRRARLAACLFGTMQRRVREGRSVPGGHGPDKVCVSSPCKRVCSWAQTVRILFVWHVGIHPNHSRDRALLRLALRLLFLHPVFLPPLTPLLLRLQSLRRRGHVSPVRRCMWHPTAPNDFITCAEDGTVRLWDANQPKFQKAVLKGCSIGHKRSAHTRILSKK